MKKTKKNNRKKTVRKINITKKKNYGGHNGVIEYKQKNIMGCQINSNKNTSYWKKQSRLVDNMQLCDINYTNGDVYNGYTLNGLKKGSGIMKYTDGSEYNGEWVDDKRNGRGKMKYADGSEYNGEWVDDKINDNNVSIKYNNGDYYFGDCKNNIKEGYGIMTYNNGEVYYGNWKDDMKTDN